MDDCTLIIVSHERKDLLIKSFNYHKKYFKKILILDSSKLNNRLLFDNDFKYFHLSNFSLAEKIYYGLKKTKTKYSELKHLWCLLQVLRMRTYLH